MVRSASVRCMRRTMVLPRGPTIPPWVAMLPRIRVCPVCCPVTSTLRDGEQTVEPAYASVKRIPSAASRSMFGVRILVWP
jgi:hypothetical protein